MCTAAGYRLGEGRHPLKVDRLPNRLEEGEAPGSPGLPLCKSPPETPTIRAGGQQGGGVLVGSLVLKPLLGGRIGRAGWGGVWADGKKRSTEPGWFVHDYASPELRPTTSESCRPHCAAEPGTWSPWNSWGGYTPLPRYRCLETRLALIPPLKPQGPRALPTGAGVP